MAASAKTNGMTIRVKSLTLKLPGKLPFAVIRHINAESGAMDIAKVLDTILGEEQAESVWGLGLDIDEGTELVDKIIGKYGVDAGK